ncbi:uncharacterized protein LOC123314765 isoform X2 [Coccinella septempunctata]|nr:uncharacterized protein LOC123314765 isoform X2 [Coccinella septempunctata]XP_044756039.1 uncharacterized protein LOC123314765 isoform X2 [Coccinella septempunctata]
MLYEEILRYLPENWSPMDSLREYEMIEIPVSSREYQYVSLEFQAQFGIGPLYRIQNPQLFTKFNLKKAEYATRGYHTTLTLFHDTVQSNVESIVTYNIDWRYGERQRYGPGVYFSTSSFRAQRRSNIKLGPHRAMFLFDVLVGNVQTARNGEYLPDIGFDTVISPDGETYVKYFDHEYYPSYVLYYEDVRMPSTSKHRFS